MQSALSKNIFSTLIYYDILDYPLTAFEVWKYLNTGTPSADQNEPVSLGEIMQALPSEELKKKIETDRGFYFLRGRESLVEKRLENNKLSEQKFKIIRRVVFWLRFMPYVRMVAVTGTVAMKNANRKSDLDLLIVFKHGRIFLGRIFVTALIHLMGKRRYGRKVADRICLNCFLTDASLGSRLKDAFSASEYFFIVPLVGQRVFAEFQKKNDWIKKFRRNFCPDAAVNLKTFPDEDVPGKIRGAGEAILEWGIFDFLEDILGKWQIGRIANDPRTKEDGSIIMADSEALIFFHHAHSLTIDKRLQERINEGVLEG